jgi:hypothetical protein
MVFMHTARMSMGGKVPRHQLSPRGGRCSTLTLTITLTVPCTSTASRGDPCSGSDGGSDISNNMGSGSNRGNNHNGGSNNSSNDLHRGPGGTPRTQQMTVATTEVVVQPIVVNWTKDAPLDISLNHKRLLEETPRVDDLLASSEDFAQAYPRKEAAGTSKLYSRCGGSVNQQLNRSDDVTPRPRRLPCFS